MKTRNNRFVKMLVAVLALALALLPAATALADDPSSYNDEANITVGKTLEATQEGVFPAVSSFQFLLEAVSYTPGPTSSSATSYDSTNLPMPGSAAGGYQIITISGFSASASGTTQTKTSTTNNITYSQAGVYTYRLTERIPGMTDTAGTVSGSQIPGVEYDETVYYVNVYVGNVLNDDGTPKLDSSGNVVVNVYAITAWETNNTSNLDPTQQDNGGNPPISSTPGVLDDGKIGITLPEDTDGSVRNISYPFLNAYDTADLVVTKLVTGDMADVDLEFSFTLKLVKASGANDTSSYTYEVYDMGDDRAVDGGDDSYVSDGTISNNGTFTLTHNQYIKVVGLPDGEKVTTTETGTTDYKTTITAEHGNDDNPAAETTVKTDVTTNKTTNQQTIYTGDGAINQDNFTNNKESVTPTGVILDVLPYVLLVAAVVLLAIMILKKRKADK